MHLVTLLPVRTMHITKYTGLSCKQHSISTVPLALGFLAFTVFGLHSLIVLLQIYKIRGVIRSRVSCQWVSAEDKFAMDSM